MGLGKTFTSVAAEMICKLLTEKVVMGLPLSILWGNTPNIWVDMAQRRSRGYRWRTGVVSVADTEFSTLQPVRDPVNSTAGASSTCISLWTNPGGDNSQSCRHNQECHQCDDILNRFYTHYFVAYGRCRSHPWGSEHQDWRAGKLMEYPPWVAWYLNIQSQTIQQSPTVTLFMEVWDMWWFPSVQDQNFFRLVSCHECANSIQTSSDSNARFPSTIWLVFSDDVAVFRSAWRSRRRDCDGKSWHRGTAFLSEVFDARHPDRRPRRSAGWGTLDDPNCKAQNDKDGV